MAVIAGIPIDDYQLYGSVSVGDLLPTDADKAYQLPPVKLRMANFFSDGSGGGGDTPTVGYPIG